MSHTNETQHYGLSQYIGTDIINPLTDFNGDNAKIDEALYDANSNAGEAKTVAQSASDLVGTYDARITALEQGESGDNTKVIKTQAMIAPPFDKLKAGGYAVDDVVTYNDKLYKFVRQHVGDWIEADAETCDVLDLIDNGGSGDYDAKINATQSMIAPAFNASKVGGYAINEFVT